MVSCHSFNGEHVYKQGCIGYARDGVSLIVFTAADDFKGIFNRKTTRQLFHYRRGALIQSRLYTSRTGVEYGGVRADEISEHWENKEYRVVVQDLIAACESVKSKWKTSHYKKTVQKIDHRGYTRYTSVLNEFGIEGYVHSDFGGYADWEEFATRKGLIHISVLKPLKDYATSFTIGEAALNIEDGWVIYADQDII